MKEELENLLREAREIIEKANSKEELENFKIRFLGRKGLLREILERIVKLNEEERKELGRYFNEIKEEIEKMYEEKKERIAETKEIKFDIHHPGAKIEKGHIHILNQAIKEIKEIFMKMGFEVEKGREIVSEYENFDSLNIPENHPARDLWDTLWLSYKDKKNRYLLRTHTSAHQVEILRNKKLPLRVVIPGKVFRREATDQRHETQFHQLEGLAVGENANLQELRGVLTLFFKEFFKKELKIIFRSSYFPFTEPSVEVDLECVLCSGKGCAVCKNIGYLEIAGAGMVHPFVLKEAGIDPNKFFGYAFGLGIERIVMLRHNINDIRYFNSGDLRFIKQF